MSNEHYAMRIAAIAAGGLATVALFLVDVISTSVDIQDVLIAGVSGGGILTLGWRVWADRQATNRADATSEARVTDLKEQLASMASERDFWRDRAMPPDSDDVA